MRRAQLADGQTIDFPDGAADPAMDAAVQAFMQNGMNGAAAPGAPAAPGGDPATALVGMLIKSMSEHMMQTQAQQQQTAVASEQKEAMEAQAMQGVVEQLSAIAGGLQGSQELVVAINNLSVTIGEGVQAIINALNTPRAIMNDASGMPTQIGPVSTNTAAPKRVEDLF